MGNEIYAKQINQTLTQTFIQNGLKTKQITIKEKEGPNQREEVRETHPTPLTIKVIIKNQNNNKVDLIT